MAGTVRPVSWEERLPDTAARIRVRVPRDAFRLRDALRTRGSTLLLCGGAVRDALLLRTRRDLDFCSDASGVWHAAGEAGLRTKPHMARFVQWVRMGGAWREVSMPFRGRTTLVEDAQGRDMNANALYSTLEGDVLDPLGVLPEVLAGHLRILSMDSLFDDDNRGLRFLLLHHALLGDAPHDKVSLEWCRQVPPCWDHPRHAASMLRMLSTGEPARLLRRATSYGMMDPYGERSLRAMERAWRLGERRPHALMRHLDAWRQDDVPMLPVAAEYEG